MKFRINKKVCIRFIDAVSHKNRFSGGLSSQRPPASVGGCMYQQYIFVKKIALFTNFFKLGDVYFPLFKLVNCKDPSEFLKLIPNLRL